MKRIQVLGGLAVLGVGVGIALAQAPANMSFFVTSANPGKGGNLGGLAGADAHCQSLAAAVGAGGKTWRAYLSTEHRQRQGSYRRRPVAQRQGRGHRAERRGSAQREQQDHGRNGAHRERRGAERIWRSTRPARATPRGSCSTTS